MVYNADGTMTNEFDVVLGDYYANPPDIYEIVKFITGADYKQRKYSIIYIRNHYMHHCGRKYAVSR